MGMATIPPSPIFDDTLPNIYLVTSAMISRHALITISDSQVSCDLAGEAAILNLADGVYYGLDQVGAYVWKMLGEPRTLGELCDGVLEEYDVDPAECERDIAALITELEAKGLVNVSGEVRA